MLDQLPDALRRKLEQPVQLGAREGLAFGRALHLDETAGARHDNVHVAAARRVFAVVEIAGVPEHEPTKARWSWRFAIRPVIAVGSLEDAPAIEEAGIFPQSLWRHSHIRLTEQQFTDARELISRVARGRAARNR